METKNSFSFKFFDIIQSDGISAKVFLRITVARKKVEIYTGHTVLAESWNESLQQYTHKKDRILNEDLTEIKNKIISIKRRLQYEEKPVSALCDPVR